MLLDSVFIITAAVHRGNLASYIKGSFTDHLYHLKCTQAYIHTQKDTLLIQCAKDIVALEKRLILRLKDVVFQSLLPKLLALGSEVCFYDCSGFCVNELKFHLSGAPCPCQHILQIES